MPSLNSLQPFAAKAQLSPLLHKQKTFLNSGDKLRVSESGNALVELAISLPMMMLLFTGVLSFAIACSNQLTLTQAVGSGAQLLQQLRSATTDPCKDTLTAIENSAPSLNPANISLTLTLNGTKVSGSSCSGSQANLIESAPVTVVASYPCNLQFYGIKLAASCQLSAQVTEYEY